MDFVLAFWCAQAAMKSKAQPSGGGRKCKSDLPALAGITKCGVMFGKIKKVKLSSESNLHWSKLKHAVSFKRYVYLLVARRQIAVDCSSLKF